MKRKTKLKAEDIKNLEIRIKDLDVDVDVNPDVISEEEYERICEIVDAMSKDIWIDKTYVNYDQNMFNDAFIVEDGWYELIDLVKPSLLGKRISKNAESEIAASLMTIGITYLYSILDKYNYDCSAINLSVKHGKRLMVEYYNDKRTKWER